MGGWDKVRNGGWKRMGRMRGGGGEGRGGGGG